MVCFAQKVKPDSHYNLKDLRQAYIIGYTMVILIFGV